MIYIATQSEASACDFIFVVIIFISVKKWVILLLCITFECTHTANESNFISAVVANESFSQPNMQLLRSEKKK